ncbi:MAG: hypothetical protein H6709_23380 [Kofleriaceae bacterium]|nr:hypothetical protein [Myxococcales bacterium]MCB9562836.1 hypothetical protein [Kofleriaceae bacterium]MCB9575028.1 hypothetical protein [Kofleriaceae bacterium]
MQRSVWASTGRSESASTARAALEVFLAATVEILERAAPLTSVMRAAGEPDAKAVYERGEVRRAGAYRAVLKAIGRKPRGLRAGLTVKRATDVLLTVASGEVYQMLRDRGWRAAEAHAWMRDVLCDQLLGS